MCQIIFSILSYFVCFVQAFSASLGILYTRRGNGHGHELDHYDNATHFGNLCNHQRQRHSVGCSHRHRRAGRHHVGNFHGGFTLPMERRWKIDGACRVHRRPLPFNPTAAEPSFSKHKIRPGACRLFIRQYLCQFSRPGKCRNSNGHTSSQNDGIPYRPRNRIGRNVSSDRAEYCLYPADSRHCRCCSVRTWLRNAL